MKTLRFRFHDLIKNPLRALAALLAFSAFVDRSSAHVLPAECNRFEILLGDPLTARHILLGEVHTERNSTVACIDALVREKHLVLLEGEQLGVELPCASNSKHGISNQPGRVCKGWDDMAALESLVVDKNHLQGKKAVLSFLEEQYQNNWPDKKDELFLAWARNFYEQLQTSTVQNPEACSQDVLIANPELAAQLTFKETLDDFFQSYLSHHSVKKSFGSMRQAIDQQAPWEYKNFDLDSAVTSIHDKQSAQSLIQRNRSLLKALDQHREETVFLIAGRAHLRPSFFGCENPLEMDEAPCEVLEALEKHNDTAMLIMRQPLPSNESSYPS